MVGPLPSALRPSSLNVGAPCFLPPGRAPSGMAAGNLLPLGSPIRAPKQCPSLIHFPSTPYADLHPAIALLAENLQQGTIVASPGSCSPASSCAHGAFPCLLSVPSDQQQGLPLLHSAAALPFALHSPRRVSSLSCSLRSPIRDAIETHGEKPLAALAAIIFFCVLGKMLNRCRCLIAASRRCRASCLARLTKCRAMWTAHASSPDSFRLIDL
jgi:hypothetical protein